MLMESSTEPPNSRPLLVKEFLRPEGIVHVSPSGKPPADVTSETSAVFMLKSVSALD